VIPASLQFEGAGLRGTLFVLGRLQGLPGELEELLFGRSLRQVRGGFGDGGAGGFDALVESRVDLVGPGGLYFIRRPFGGASPTAKASSYSSVRLS